MIDIKSISDSKQKLSSSKKASIPTKRYSSLPPKKERPKVFILDTNVLINDPEAFLNFKEHDVVIPGVVIEELEKNKSRLYNARRAIAILDELNISSDWKTLKSGGRVRIDLNAGYNNNDLLGFNTIADIQIIAVAKHYMENNKGNYSKVIFVSNDKAARLKAKVLKISTEAYKTDKVDITKDEFDMTRILMNQEELEKIGAFDNKKVDIEKSAIRVNCKLYENKPLLLCLNDGSKDGVPVLSLVYKKNKFIKCNTANERVYGKNIIKPYVPNRLKDVAFNAEQEVLIENINDPDILVISVMGGAGTGKTKIAAGSAIIQVLEGKYEKLIITKPQVVVGEKDGNKGIGFLPGDKNAKIDPWIRPIKKHIISTVREYMKKNTKPLNDKLAKGLNKNTKTEKKELKETSSDEEMWQDLIYQGIVEVEDTGFIKGMDYENTIILVDESQDLTYHEAKTWLTRVSENTKIIFLGDIEQIDALYVEKETNGLINIYKKTVGVKFAASHYLKIAVRSEVAEWAIQNF